MYLLYYIKILYGISIVDMKVNNCAREVGTAAMASHRTPVSRNYVAAPDAVTVPVGDNPLHPIAVIPRYKGMIHMFREYCYTYFLISV